jgi:putative Holliday junction resolvase
MGRWLGIDYGEKRVGLAITDPLCLFVNPFKTIENRSEMYLFEELLKILCSYEIDKIVIGLPLNKEGEDTFKTREVRAFFYFFQSLTNIPLYFFNELYSTCDANDIMKSKGLNWKESRKIIDQVAAAVILKSFMESNDTIHFSM